MNYEVHKVVPLPGGGQRSVFIASYGSLLEAQATINLLPKAQYAIVPKVATEQPSNQLQLFN